MEDLKNIVSKNISTLRISRKMTQFELGEILSYSDKAISKWERGEAIPDAYVLKKLSSFFDVSIDYLLSEHDEDEALTVKSTRRYNTRVISMISFLGTWTLTLIVFVALWLFGSLQWLLFVYALPISLVVMIVLTSVWGKAKTNIYYISLFVWSILATVYFTVLENNWWQLFLIGIPLQIIVLLVFRIPLRTKKQIK